MLNSNSITGKLQEIKTYVEIYKPCIISITETKIDHNFQDNELLGAKYTIIRRDRNNKGGGVLMAIYNGNKSIRVINSKSGPGESVTATLQILNNITFNLVTFYRPPHEQDLEQMETLLNVSNSVYPSIFIGDFNLPDIDWAQDNFGQVSQTSHRKKLHKHAIKLFQENNLSQLINEPTHVKGNTLDLVLVNNMLFNDLLVHGEVLPRISDHNMIKIKLTPQFSHACKSKMVSKTKLNFCKANYPVINNKFKALHNQFRCQNMTTEQLWCSFKETVLNCANEHIPTLLSRPKGKPWMTRELIRLIRKRDRIFKRNKLYPTANNIAQENDMNKKVKLAIEKAKCDYMEGHISNQLSEGNTKPFFNLIKQSRGQANQINSLTDTPNECVADKLAEHFSSVYAMDSHELPQLDVVEPGRTMTDIQIDPKGIKKLIINLDPRKAGGPDLISAYLLKTFAVKVEYFVPCISHIFQKSLEEGMVPRDWKNANICPVYKGGKRDEVNNYRPISLTCILSKTLEHILASEMWAHINEYNIIPENQHGFRSSLNTTTQLLHVVHNATKALNDKRAYHLVSFDFSKAFDKVPHNLLIHKLNKYKFNMKSVRWIEEWLKERTSKVTVNGLISDTINCTSGVPQGSVLGPLLFLLYINDIPSKIEHSECRLYADDTLICSDAQNSSLQKDIDELHKWSKIWKMPFNAGKCIHIQIGKSRPDFTLYLGGVEIPSSNTLKYLGINFTSDLKWAAHITTITKKTNKTLGLLRRCLKGSSKKLKNLAFNTIAMPILEYASQVWSPYIKYLEKDLDRIHRSALRWIHRIPKYESLSETIQSENIITLKERRDQLDTNFLRKIEFGLFDIKLEKYVKKNNSHNTRNMVVKPHFNVNQFKQSFYNRMSDQVKVLFDDRQ